MYCRIAACATAAWQFINYRVGIASWYLIFHLILDFVSWTSHPSAGAAYAEM